MAGKNTDRIQKEWVVRQLQHAAKLKTLEAVKKYQEQLLERLEGETNTTIRYFTAGDLTFDQVVEIFGLKPRVNEWKQRGEMCDVPRSLIYFLAQLKNAPYDKSSEAYNRIAIDYLIIACMEKHKNLMSKQSKLPASDPTAATSSILQQSELPTDDRHNQTATIVPVLDQVTEPSESTFQPRPIKVFPEMSLAVRVKRKNKEWLVSGIADWAMGYGDRATLEDRAVLLAIEAKRTEKLSSAEAQLLTYLATIRQLRIQADKKNVMTQGFYSDGENHRFMCIRNDGTVMKSQPYDISLGNDSSCLKVVLNFLLGMVTTAAESSPNTSPIKPGPERDEKIDNFDRDIFVEVFEDPKVDDVPIPTIYHDYIEEEDEWSDIIPDEE